MLDLAGVLTQGWLRQGLLPGACRFQPPGHMDVAGRPDPRRLGHRSCLPSPSLLQSNAPSGLHPPREHTGTASRESRRATCNANALRTRPRTERQQRLHQGEWLSGVSCLSPRLGASRPPSSTSGVNPYNDPEYRRARAWLTDHPGTRCEINGPDCTGIATTIDHHPALKLHHHRRGSGCCQVRAACGRCNYSTGATLGNRLRDPITQWAHRTF